MFVHLFLWQQDFLSAAHWQHIRPKPRNEVYVPTHTSKTYTFSRCDKTLGKEAHLRMPLYRMDMPTQVYMDLMTSHQTITNVKRYGPKEVPSKYRFSGSIGVKQIGCMFHEFVFHNEISVSEGTLWSIVSFAGSR